jgi:hypothetical protein
MWAKPVTKPSGVPLGDLFRNLGSQSGVLRGSDERHLGSHTWERGSEIANLGTRNKPDRQSNGPHDPPFAASTPISAGPGSKTPCLHRSLNGGTPCCEY